MRFNFNNINRLRKFGSLMWLLCLILFFSTCNESFDPLQENNKYHFSIYGYIDAAADTQWVRISPTRQDINEIPDPTGIQVTLEHIQSGKTVVMNDSLFSSKGFLNYWTTIDIENEQTYRITAERDGKSSWVTVTTPEEIPAPNTLPTGNPSGFNVYIDDNVEHIADVQSVWYVILNRGTAPERKIYTFGIRHTLIYSGVFDQTYFAFANYQEESDYIDQSSGSAEVSVVKRQFFIAAAGPEWDENISSINDLEYFLDPSVSNVVNGLGYVVGIDSKWIEQKVCLTDQAAYVPCAPDDGPFWYSE